MLNTVKSSPKTQGGTLPLSHAPLYVLITVKMYNRSLCTCSLYTKVVMAVSVTVPGILQAV
jgi:hypothetical protein